MRTTPVGSMPYVINWDRPEAPYGFNPKRRSICRTVLVIPAQEGQYPSLGELQLRIDGFRLANEGFGQEHLPFPDQAPRIVEEQRDNISNAIAELSNGYLRSVTWEAGTTQFELINPT